MTLCIDVSNLRLVYKDVIAIDDLTFSLEPNRIYGLLGRNGSGKTSLLSMLSAFRKPTSGEVLVGGQPVWENPAVTSQIAFIRESGDTVEDSEKPKEALRYAEYLRPNWDSAYANALIERFQVPMNTKIGEMSRGQRSALGIVLGITLTAPVFPILGVAMAFLFRSTAIAITSVLALIFAPAFFGPLLPRR